MALRGLTPHPNKAVTRHQLKTYMLAHCDPDLQQTFAPHGFLMEPLLCQIIRDLKALQGVDPYANYLRTLADTVASLAHPTGGDSPTDRGESPAEEPASSATSATSGGAAERDENPETAT